MALGISTNHYPLRSLYRSVYRGHRPALVEFRRRGLDVRHEGTDLAIYHTTGAELPALGLHHRELVTQVMEVAEANEAYHYHIAHLLRHAGLLQAGRRHREYFYRDRYEEFNINTEVGAAGERYLPGVRGYHRWTWDIELHSGRFWLVPRLGLRYVSATGLTDLRLSNWLRRTWTGGQVMALNMLTGVMRRIEWDQENWVWRRREKAERLEDGPWHVTLAMEDLKRIHRSQDAFHRAQEAMHAEPRDLSTTPFAAVLETSSPLVIPAHSLGTVEGNHLRFGKGVGGRIKSVIGKGLVEPPLRPVRLILCAPDSLWSQDQIKKYLRYLFGRPEEERRQELGLPPADTVRTIWQARWGLGPYDFDTEVLTYTSDGVLSNPAALDAAITRARGDGRALVGILLLPNELMPKAAWNAIHRYFRAKLRVIPVMAHTLTDKGQTASGYFGIWAGMAAEIAVRAGGVPWDLYNLPGVTEQTVFLGLDLGHNHRERRSRLALTLFDHRGRSLVSEPRVLPLPVLNERLPDRSVLAPEISNLLSPIGWVPDQVIVHRDGRFLPGEEEELLAALRTIPNVSLVGIKKDAQTYFGLARDGLYWRLTHDRSLVLTSTKGGGARPLEVEVRVPGRLTLDAAVAQVFWLTRVYQGDVMHPPKLPVTTRMANNSAGTGDKVHLKAWSRGESWGD